MVSLGLTPEDVLVRDKEDQEDLRLISTLWWLVVEDAEAKLALFQDAKEEKDEEDTE